MMDVDLTAFLAYLSIILVIFWSLFVYWKLVVGGRLFLSATNWFLIWQLLLLIGVLSAADLREPLDLTWLMFSIGSVVCFTIGAMVANWRQRFRPRLETDRFVSLPVQFDLNSHIFGTGIVGVALVCTVVGSVFAATIGYNVFLTSLSGLITGEDPQLVTERFMYLRTDISYGVERYLAPGYAMQFTFVLLPLLLCLLYFRVRHTKRLPEIVFTAFLLIADLFFLTLHGGRGPVLHSVLIFMILVSPFGPFPSWWKHSKRIVVPLIVFFLGFSIYATFVTGRVGSNVEGGTILLTIENLYRRIMDEGPASLILMRTVITQAPVWGAQWVQDLQNLLPGSKGIGIGNELHALLYSGSYRGYAGLSAWGWFWYNWGCVGALVLAFITGFLLQTFTITYLRGKRSLSRVVILFVAGLRLGVFSDLYSLFLNGFVTTLIFYAILRLISPRNQRYIGGFEPRTTTSSSPPISSR